MITYYKEVLKTQYTFHIIALGALFAIASIFTLKEVFTYFAFICLFTGFDCIGFGNQINRTAQWNNLDILAPYRVMQTMFHVILMTLVYIYAGWIVFFACLFGWWIGGCDLLFYIVLREKLKECDYWWMKGWSIWLIITPIKKLLSHKDYDFKEGDSNWSSWKSIFPKKLALRDEYIGQIEFIAICSAGLFLGLWIVI